MSGYQPIDQLKVADVGKIIEVVHDGSIVAGKLKSLAVDLEGADSYQRSSLREIRRMAIKVADFELKVGRGTRFRYREEIP